MNQPDWKDGDVIYNRDTKEQGYYTGEWQGHGMSGGKPVSTDPGWIGVQVEDGVVGKGFIEKKWRVKDCELVKRKHLEVVK